MFQLIPRYYNVYNHHMSMDKEKEKGRGTRWREKEVDGERKKLRRQY